MELVKQPKIFPFKPFKAPIRQMYVHMMKEQQVKRWNSLRGLTKDLTKRSYFLFPLQTVIVCVALIFVKTLCLFIHAAIPFRIFSENTKIHHDVYFLPALIFRFCVSSKQISAKHLQSPRSDVSSDPFSATYGYGCLQELDRLLVVKSSFKKSSMETPIEEIVFIWQRCLLPLL